jgi:hypothetical protein
LTGQLQIKKYINGYNSITNSFFNFKFYYFIDAKGWNEQIELENYFNEHIGELNYFQVNVINLVNSHSKQFIHKAGIYYLTVIKRTIRYPDHKHGFFYLLNAIDYDLYVKSIERVKHFKLSDYMDNPFYYDLHGFFIYEYYVENSYNKLVLGNSYKFEIDYIHRYNSILSKQLAPIGFYSGYRIWRFKNL